MDGDYNMLKVNKFEVPQVEDKLQIPLNIYMDMMRLANAVKSDEVGWMFVTDIDNIFLVRDMYLPNQKVHGTTTEFDKDQTESIRQAMVLAQDNTRFGVWGHSHVKMKPSPSGQDDKQIRELWEQGNANWLRLIINQNNEYTCVLYDGCCEREVEIEIIESIEGYEEKWKEHTERVKPLKTSYSKSNHVWTSGTYNANVNGKKGKKKSQDTSIADSKSYGWGYDAYGDVEEVEVVTYGDLLDSDDWYMEVENYFEFYYYDGIDIKIFCDDYQVYGADRQELMQLIREDVRYKVDND